MAKVANQIRTSFNVWSEKFNTSYDGFVAELEGKIATMQSQGMSTEAIFSRLERVAKDEVDVFGGFTGKIEKFADDLSSIIAQTASNSEFDAEEKLIWTLDPAAKEHCIDCLVNEGKEALTFAEWEEIGLPGVGNTECGSYCKCTLESAG